MNKTKKVLEEVIKRIEPPKEEVVEIEKYLKEFLDELKKRIKKKNIKAEIFVGGSFAKKTLIKKDSYDVDVFLRFDKKYGEEISILSSDILDGIKNVSVIHGSRNYFRLKVNPKFSIEIIPVIKVNKPKDSSNITDLSYSHVKYINSRIKNKKILDEIKILKAFCYATKCYGAESYVHGFSGYALELLIYYYKSFEKMLKEFCKEKGKIIIDIEKLYNNKQEIMMDLNSSKLHSPIILIDPTFKERNAAAALSQETFERFKKAGKNFLKNPSIKIFEIEEIDFEKEIEKAKNKKEEFVLIEISTDKQEGDIAGSKLLKFSKHLEEEVSKKFYIKSNKFEYAGEKSAKIFFAGISKKEILFSGPKLNDEKNVKRFKEEHKKSFVKKGKIYAKEKVKVNLKKFVEIWKKKNERKMKEMSIKEIRIENI